MDGNPPVDRLFARASRAHRAGRLAPAEVLYRRVLAQAPNHAGALHMLGLLCSQQGRYAEAQGFIRRAIAVDGRNPAYHNNLGEIYRRQGKLDQAVRCYRHALALAPEMAEVHYNLANALKAQGRVEMAVEHYRRAVVLRPGHARAYYNLGNLWLERQEYNRAVAAYRQAIASAPDFALAHHNLGTALLRLGRPAEAAAALRRAVALAPGDASAHANLARALEDQHQFSAAISHYRRATQLSPDDPTAHANLGTALMRQGRTDEAMACFHRALHHDPHLAAAHLNLGSLFTQRGQWEQAVHHCQQAVQAEPGSTEATVNLILALEMQGRLGRARETFRQLAAHGPVSDLFRLHVDTLCPLIPGSNREIDRYRTGLDRVLEEARQRDLSFDLAELHLSAASPPHGLNYQGRDDRALKEKWAALFTGRLPQGHPPGGTGRPHIGFLVTRGHEGNFVRAMQRILNDLSGESFRLTVACSGPRAVDRIRPAIANPAVEYLLFPRRIDRAVEVLRQARFDVLYYREIGSDTVNYFLPFFRLAPVQCQSWGIPITAGIPQVDYYLSCQLLETEESDAFYTETLVRLRGLPTFNRPPMPQRLRDRSHFGLEEGQHVYVCAQNLLKVHPDFDRLAGPVLRRDPQGVLLFFGTRHPHLSALLRRRFRRTMPDVVDRVRFLPRLSQPDYMNVLALADVSLDTHHYCGSNCTNDAFVAGTPVVTWPGRFQRGRYTWAAYRTMGTGVEECVAGSPEAYVALALALGTDRAHRDRVSRRIQAACPVLFEDTTSVQALAEFLRQAAAEGRGS